MKRFIPFALLLLFIAVGSSNLYAQPKKRPLPDWIFEKPQRSNTTFYYHVEKGTGETEPEARNAAYTQAFMQVALKLGIPLNTEDISEAIASGTNIRMLSQRFTIPINVVCYISRRNEEQGGWDYWLLCQVPEIGYADNVRFDDFSDCYKADKYKELIAKRDAVEKERVQASNTRAIIASTFIPGLGQLIKGQAGAGTAFLVGELVLFGGGTACHFLGQEQKKILENPNTSYEAYSAAKKTKQAYDIAMYTAFGVGAAVHVVNMVNAWLIKDKHLQGNTTFAPAIIPINEYSQPTYAMGAGVQIKF